MATGLARKRHKYSWVRYERDFSDSLWHTDWHVIRDPRWRGKHLIAFEDDASRFITGFGVFDSATSANSARVLEAAIRRHRRPASVLTDNGSQFTANVEAAGRSRPVDFERVMMKHHIRHTRARVRHPQTNGKIEKFFDIFERKIGFFGSVEEFMEWYNHVRPHGSLDLATPAEAYEARRAPDYVPADPAIRGRNPA